jgi:hypothetical protein
VSPAVKDLVAQLEAELAKGQGQTKTA